MTFKIMENSVVYIIYQDDIYYEHYTLLLIYLLVGFWSAKATELNAGGGVQRCKLTQVYAYAPLIPGGIIW